MITTPPSQSRDSAVPDGITAGVIAGTVWLVAQIAVSIRDGAPVLSPFRLIASIALGPAALSSGYPVVSILAVGIGVHLILSAAYGVAAFLLLARTRRLDTRPWFLLAFGAVFGALPWALNFLVLGSIVFRQFVVVDQIWNGVFAHVVCFGCVLGGYALIVRPRASNNARDT